MSQKKGFAETASEYAALLAVIVWQDAGIKDLVGRHVATTADREAVVLAVSFLAILGLLLAGVTRSRAVNSLSWLLAGAGVGVSVAGYVTAGSLWAAGLGLVGVVALKVLRLLDA